MKHPIDKAVAPTLQAFPLRYCLFALTFLVLILSEGSLDAAQNARVPLEVTKNVSFAVLEDYDKGQDLSVVAEDFRLMNQLGIDVMRCSFGWDDYEPAQGHYDFAWLKQFVALAQSYKIKLRPYLGYTPDWAGIHGIDKMVWNDPPANYQDWYRFVYNLAAALQPYSNVLSYEIYNEENDAFWWEGSFAQYSETLRQAAKAIHAANPKAQVILGGMVFPDDDWLSSLLDAGDAPFYDILPFHAYPETWENTTVEKYLDTQYYDYFVPDNKEFGGNKPIWVNEMGYATTTGRSEHQQADWFVRAVSTFLADPHIESVGIYEIRDLAANQHSLGGDANYHLGLVYPYGRKKMAFYTVKMLTNLLNVGNITIADSEAHVTITSGQEGELYEHLFKRPDGSQVLFVYDKKSTPTVSVRLQTPGRQARAYRIDGTSVPYQDFDGHTVREVSLSPGTVSIFKITP